MDSNNGTVVHATVKGGYSSQKAFIHAFAVLQSFRKNEVLCDIKLETDDGTIVYGHKVVLASASQYFQTMFTSVEGINKEHIIIRELNSTVLQLVVCFIYTAQIMVTENNVQGLLLAAKFLQINEIEDACCDFLKTLLQPTNCLSIMELADLHGFMKLLSNSESFIQHHFPDVVLGNEFLTLSFEKLIELISCDKLRIPSEEIVFECVIRWVNHDANSRKCFFSKLMEHVRLPLTSTKYLKERVEEEPLVKQSFECQVYIIEALHFHLSKYEFPGTITNSNRTKPRHYVKTLPKVLLVIGGKGPTPTCDIEWYDQKTNLWMSGPELSANILAGFAVLKDKYLFAMGGWTGSDITNSVYMLDLSLPSSWVPMDPMLTERQMHGVAVLENCIFAVGGKNGTGSLSCGELWNYTTKKWLEISNMSYRRNSCGVGVLNNLLYAIGGRDGGQHLKTVECYLPSTDTWTSVADMCVKRSGAGVGVLDGVLYVVGGRNNSRVHKSVEAYIPSTGVWTSVSDMRVCRVYAGVFAFEGLLYVVGGLCQGGSTLDSVEIYNPNTDTWSKITASMNNGRAHAGVFVVDKPGF